MGAPVRFNLNYAGAPAVAAGPAVGMVADLEAMNAAAPAAAPAEPPQLRMNTIIATRNARQASLRANQVLTQMRRNLMGRFRTAINKARRNGNVALEQNLISRERNFSTQTQQWRSRKSRSVDRRKTRKQRKY